MKRVWKKSDIKQISIQLLVGEAILFFINLICYQDVIWLLPLQIFLYPYFQISSQYIRNKNHKIYLEGFRELLGSLMTSMQAGYSFENACRLAIEELGALYKNPKHPMMQQMFYIRQGLDLHYPTDQLFSRYAEDTGVKEAYQLAVLLAISNKMGNNLVAVLKGAMDSLQERMDTHEEIDVLLSGKNLEKNIMILMPFAILLYMQVSNPGYLNFFYDTFAGHIIMTLILCAVLACYYWTENIMKIGNEL